MLNKNLVRTYNQIVNEAYKMVHKNINADYLTGNLNYCTIFTKSEKEFNEITDELLKNAKVSDEQPSGDYYLLDTSIKTKHGNIKNCRAMKPKKNFKELGYVDFEVVDYEEFKTKYSKKDNFRIIKNVHGLEMIELRDNKFKVRAYFPNDFY